MIGSTVSHFKIIERLGAGGMGVVYKAQDLKLERIVALKFLPHHLAATPEEQARFLQEARAASALNHAHICAIHSIGEEDGRQFIEMEYVDGQNLRQLLPLPKTQQAVEYAIQVGEALQEAHSQGVVHRDVKTDNIMVNSKNQVKVMDFGLAKLKGSLKLTKTSSTVGTLAYMAPEQIQGGEVDARSDIFSFGVVLYEMLTGHLPFRGEHEAAMVYSIANEEPIPIQQYLPDASSEILHIVDRALEKDPEDRYQSVHDMLIDLKRLRKETARVHRSGPVLAETGIRSSTLGTPAKRRRLAGSAMALLVVLAAVVVIRDATSTRELNPEMTTRVLRVPYRDIARGGMSPDGNWLVFPAREEGTGFDVYLMNLSQGQIRRVTNESAVSMSSASLSPDVGTILYTTVNLATRLYQLRRVPSLGGEPRIMAESTDYALFSPDGKNIYGIADNELSASRRMIELWRSAADGSGRRLVMADTVANRPNVRRWFSPSPDETHIAWTKNYPEGFSEIMVRELSTGADRRLTFDKKIADDPLWTDVGYIIFSSNRGGNMNLWTVRADGGEPSQLTRGAGPDVPLGMSVDGRKLLYEEAQDVAHIQLVQLRDGTARRLTVDDRVRGIPALSPSGRHVAFPSQEIDAVSNVRDIYVIDRDGRNLRRITDDPTYKVRPSWSPDEQWITYLARGVAEPEESSSVYLIRPDTPGYQRLIGKGTLTHWINERQFTVRHGNHSVVASIDRPGYERFSPDSMSARPILGGRYVLFFDFREARHGWWLTSASSFASEGSAKARQVCRGYFWGATAQDGRLLFYWNWQKRELHRVRLPEGKDERVNGTFPGLLAYFNVDEAGEQVVYAENYSRRRFVLIEDVFK